MLQCLLSIHEYLNVTRFQNRHELLGFVSNKQAEISHQMDPVQLIFAAFLVDSILFFIPSCPIDVDDLLDDC